VNVLIAGCGDLGCRLAKLLLQQGHSVWGLKRRPKQLPNGVQAVQADLNNPVSLIGLPQVDQVVFCPTPGGRDEMLYRQTYVDGLANLLGKVPKTNLSRVIVVSSTAVYGQADGSWVDEHSACEPRAFNGQVLLEMEYLAQQFSQQSCVLRMSGLYSDGQSRLLESIIDATASVQREPDYWTNRIHRDDASAAMAFICNMNVPESVYVVNDQQPVTQAELLDWLSQQLKQPQLKTSLVNKGSNKRVNSTRLMNAGFKLKFPGYKEGYAEAIRRYLEN